MVTIARDKPLVVRSNRGQTVTLVACRVEADDRSDITAATDEALRKPPFIALMAHRTCAVAQRLGSPTRRQACPTRRRGAIAGFGASDLLGGTFFNIGIPINPNFLFGVVMNHIRDAGRLNASLDSGE
jgi:hypothetical protein